MRYVLILVFMLVVSPACLGSEKENRAAAEAQAEETKPLDLGEPTPKERSQMDREAKEKRAEESGFDEAITDDNTSEEIAGDESEARWEFN